MTERITSLRDHYQKQMAIIEDRLEMMRDGRLSLREQTLEHPNWRDVTHHAIQQDEHILEMLRDVVSRLGELADAPTV